MTKIRSEDIKLIDIKSIKPNKRNRNKHSKEQIERLCEIIRYQGFRSPLIISNQSGLLVAGHGRLQAAKKLGFKQLPVIFQDFDNEDQEYAAMVSENAIASWSELLIPEINSDIGDLDPSFDIDMLGIKNFTIDVAEKYEEIPEASEPPKEPKTKLGDLWVLDNHRLLCGDSTLIDAVERLMDGEKADMIFTDPPYGMSYGGGRAEGNHVLDKKSGVKIKAHGMIKGDDLRGEELCQLLTDSLAGAITVRHPDAAVYVCLTWRTYEEFKNAFEKVGLKLQNCIVWNKKSIGLGHGHYRPQHEFIFYSGGEWNGQKDESDVWEMTRGNTGEYVHPTQKPIELVERSIKNSSKKFGIILDLFGGSGSTLIAAEKTNRQSRIMELDPKYCDVILNRWAKMTGQDPIRDDGVKWSELQNTAEKPKEKKKSKKTLQKKSKPIRT